MTSFTTDKQTLGDLNLMGKYRSTSIYHILNHTVTRGGERVLEEMFRSPLTDAQAINCRSGIFQSFMEQPVDFPFAHKQLESVEYYMSLPAYPSLMGNLSYLCYRKAMVYIAADRMYELLVKGINDTIELFCVLGDFCRTMQQGRTTQIALCQEVEQILAHPSFAWIYEARKHPVTSLLQAQKFHNRLRVKAYEQTKRLMEIVYELDVYTSVAKVALERNFCCAEAREATLADCSIQLTDVFHPAVRGAKANSLTLDVHRNVLFLTGANMAGKSTFMKSFAIAVYLAHMGFPVPAREMRFSACDGLYTSINVSDNLSLGQSHYYAEVLRVKAIAQQVAAHKNLVVIFDELFKGTNVKDAYDATVGVLKAFAAYHNCFFIMSTHIIEVGDVLAKECANLKFAYFPTVMEKGIPRYTYRLTEGITADRHGMMIIRNEHILDIIQNGKAS